MESTNLEDEWAMFEKEISNKPEKRETPDDEKTSKRSISRSSSSSSSRSETPSPVLDKRSRHEKEESPKSPAIKKTNQNNSNISIKSVEKFAPRSVAVASRVIDAIMCVDEERRKSEKQKHSTNDEMHKSNIDVKKHEKRPSEDYRYGDRSEEKLTEHRHEHSHKQDKEPRQSSRLSPEHRHRRHEPESSGRRRSRSRSPRYRHQEDSHLYGDSRRSDRNDFERGDQKWRGGDGERGRRRGGADYEGGTDSRRRNFRGSGSNNEPLGNKRPWRRDDGGSRRDQERGDGDGERRTDRSNRDRIPRSPGRERDAQERIELVQVDEKPSDLPLDNDPKKYMKGSQRRIAELSERAQAMTGIALPKYYNPANVNPLKYAETMQKRKLLWQGKDKKVSSSWQQVLAAAGEDKSAEKFKKLVGFKAGEQEDVEGPSSGSLDPQLQKKNEELFRILDQQYEVARMSTHTHRGIGLGFVSQMSALSSQQNPPSTQQP